MSGPRVPRPGSAVRRRTDGCSRGPDPTSLAISSHPGEQSRGAGWVQPEGSDHVCRPPTGSAGVRPPGNIVSIDSSKRSLDCGNGVASDGCTGEPGMAEDPGSSRYERAYRSYYQEVLRFAAHHVTNHDDAEDIAAATYLTAWRQHPSLPDEPHMRTWLLHIARRHVSNFWRARRRSTRLVAAISAEMSSDAPDWGAGRVPALPFGLSRASLEEVMRGLRSKDQEILRLVYWNGYTHADVANALGCSVNAVNLRVSRARDTLRKRIRAALPGPQISSVDAPMPDPLGVSARVHAQFREAPSTRLPDEDRRRGALHS